MSNNVITILALPDLHGKTPKLLFEHKPDFDMIITPGDICLDNLRGEEITNFKKNQNKSLRVGEDILEQLSTFNKPIYLVPGNWEPTKFCDGIQREDRDKFKHMIEKFPLVHNCEYKSVKVENLPITIIGAGSTSAPEIISKFELQTRLKFEEDEEEIQELKSRYLYQKQKFELVNELFIEENNNLNNIKVFISHNSPYNTPLDIIKNPFNPLHNQHYGSNLARAIIEKHEPQLVISGHIHEGVGICKIKNSTCLNAGYGDNIYHLIKIDVSKQKILSIKKYGGNGV